MKSEQVSVLGLPKWASELGKKWNSGCYSVVVISGNVFDVYPTSDGYRTLRAFLFNRQFKNTACFMSYNISNGLAFANDTMKSAFFDWLSVFDGTEGTEFHTKGLPLEFFKLSAILSRFFSYVATEPDKFGGKTGVTFVVEFPEKVVPAGEDNSQPFEDRAAIATVLSWASAEQMKDHSVGVFLVTESVGKISQDITQNPNVAQVVIDLPSLAEREKYIDSLAPIKSDMPVPMLATKTAGLNLIRISNLLAEAKNSLEPVTHEYLANKKRALIEEYCQGLVRFKEPKEGVNLDLVATHRIAKKKLRDIARLFKEGKTSIIERGILVPGRVGVGKSFLIDCFASECGMPVMELGDFRSKWVGDTERQLARILMTVKALGPVVVVVDEADAVFGNRSESGDSGVSSRVFGAIAAHIGNSSLRGREIWIAMTSRPDLLAIDMKRQGRFGLCLPLFPAVSKDDIVEMFEVIAKIDKVVMPGTIIDILLKTDVFKSGITGSEAESIVKRAIETAYLSGRAAPTEDDFKIAIQSYINPLDPQLLLLQDLAAITSCSDKRMLSAEHVGAIGLTSEDNPYRLLEALKAKMRGRT